MTHDLMQSCLSPLLYFLPNQQKKVHKTEHILCAAPIADANQAPCQQN